MALYLIEDDLSEHTWYERLVAETVAAVERYLASWAAFEEYHESA